jgi:predicted CopG family antitoxin
MITTIQLDSKVKEKLDKLKIHERESYNEVIARLVMECRNTKVDEESLKETIEILSDPETLKDIAEALEEVEKGNLGKELSAIKKELV